ncbi:hypothetical protein EDB81DRAFT_144808 [Dactylonectria macrodidyma]|uniref:Mid2 domain-containing protein n=1 Tax=Dactylonectria macrodidyma TaxID=307937 RepID=A0A9P9IQJ3_9HYPO|nr:hypothetical protein EDB81DRAFT_144808 [Dactylonectria macrodidyma]
MALLTFGVDQTYSYIACSAKARTDRYYITPTVDAKTASSETSTSTTASSTAQITGTASEDKTDPTQIRTESAAESTKRDPSQSPPEESAADESTSSGNSSAPIGAIVGGAIGGLVVICGTTIAVIYLLRRNRGKQDKSEPLEQDMSRGAPQSWAYHEPKRPQALGGLGPQELPGNTHYGRENAVS